MGRVEWRQLAHLPLNDEADGAGKEKCNELFDSLKNNETLQKYELICEAAVVEDLIGAKGATRIMTAAAAVATTTTIIIIPKFRALSQFVTHGAAEIITKDQCKRVLSDVNA